MSTGMIRWSLVAVIVVGGFWLSFELGRYRAGFAVIDSRREYDAFSAQISERDQAIDALERQVAILETSREVDRETYANIEGVLAELEQQIQAQEEELAFYQGIVTPGDGVAGLRIQSVEVLPGEGDATHVLRVLLVQAIVHNERVTGSVRASLSGMLAGEAVEYGLDDLGSESEATDIPYAFRYFQTLELGLTLPAGFVPAALEIEVWPRAPRADPIVQRFPWAEISG